MRNSYKKLFLMLSLLILAVAIAACSAQEAEPEVVEVEVTRIVTETITEKGETVEVTRVVVETADSFAEPIIYNSYNSDPEPRLVDEKLVDMWNEANPDKQLQHSIVNHEDFKQAIRAYLVADPAPDVMTWFAGNRARFFIDKGLIMDISDVWEEKKAGTKIIQKASGPCPKWTATPTSCPQTGTGGRCSTASPYSTNMALPRPKPLMICWLPATH